jgi:multicomponent Na+:H+ antiporter subunit E
MTQLVRAVLLLVFWIALWGEVSLGNVLSGIAVIVLVSVLAPAGRPARVVQLHPVAIVRLAAAMARALVVSSARVAVTSIRPTPERLRATIAEVPLVGGSPLTTMIVAQLIGLTPGTMTVGIESRDGRPVLYVHALGTDDVTALRRDVQELEARVLAAHTPVRGPGEEAAP